MMLHPVHNFRAILIDFALKLRHLLHTTLNCCQSGIIIVANQKAVNYSVAINQCIVYILTNKIAQQARENVMRKLQNIHTIRLFCIFVGVFYFSISIFIDVLHNHDDVSEFHDNCAACRWLDQSQDTSISTTSAQVTLTLPNLISSECVFPEDRNLSCQFCRISFSNRSPPPLLSIQV